MILGVRSLSRGSFEEGTETDFKQLSHVPPFWDPILEHVGSQILFLCILFASFFMLVFSITFGRPPAAIFKDLGVISGCLLGSFRTHF